MEELKQKDNNSKFCKHCGDIIPKEAIICTKCGCQVEEMQNQSQPQVVINNTNTNTNMNTNKNVNSVPTNLKAKNKWVSFFLCLLLGVVGAHKFYEGKIIMGIIYLLTGGLCFIGVLVDLIVLLGKPNPYYV